jgi:hypothetical protein
MVSRRTFLHDCLVAGSAFSVLRNFTLEAAETTTTVRMNMVAKMEDALAVLSRFGPEYQGGFANHAPMVADALISMGRSEDVMPWVEEYSKNLDEHPESSSPIAEKEWMRALGDFSRHGDWVAFFQRQLEEQSWKEVLSRWVPELAPGMAAAAAHGLLRTAHIARRLGEYETKAGIRELAEGLAYWASRYQTLPASPAQSVSKMKPADAISHIELLPEDKRHGGFITTRLEALKGFAPFAPVIHQIDPSIPPSELLSDLTSTFARLYLMSSRRSLIAFVHAVTGPASIRILVPYLSRDAIVRVLRYGWQLAAAIYCSHASRNHVEIQQQDLVPENLIDQAVSAKDEHAIKFTEACLREYRIKPDPIYLVAAKNACDQLSR